MYNRDQIETVRSRADIVEIIREYVPSLKAAGRSVRGLCPFHGERTPSFHVHPEKGLYKCFGCGEAGDVIGFVAKMEQVGFTEALQMLADRVGVVLQKTSGNAKPEPEGIREKLYKLLEAAARIYEDHLWDEKAGEAARAYLEDRGIREDTIRHFGLGVATQTGAGAFETLVKRGFAIELCQQAGLVTRSNAGRFYDPMFGRLIFPIKDGFGHVVGFGGRILPQTKKGTLGLGQEEREEEGPKYLNSPETPVFSKGKLLYGLYQAKTNILAVRRALIVEGYMDVIGVHQGGVPTAVATLGTAFTRDHARLLKRYASEAVAFFDPDEAGQKAAMRGLEPMVQEDFYTRVVIAETDDDPDELIRAQGKEHFDSLVERAPDFVDYLLKTSGASAAMPLQQKAQVAKQILGIISQSPNEILKSEWTRRVAEKLGLAVDSIDRELSRKPAPKQAAEPSKKPVSNAPKRFLPTAEEEFLQLLLTAPQAWPDVGLAPDEFTVERHKILFAKLLEQHKAMGHVSVPALYDEVSQADKEWLLTLSLEEKSFPDPVERRDQLIRDVRINKDRMKLGLLTQRVATGVASAEEREEYKDLLRRVKGSSPRTVFAPK